MAKDVITRFKLETTAFDSKIKQASKELSDYSKTATQAKEGFNQFTKANVDAARALGTMATSSNNTKVKVQELVGAYNEAAKAYEKLSDEQKQSDWAKALAGSLTQLQKRIKDAKQEMQGLDNEMKSSGLFGGGKLDGMLQVFGGNLMTKAAGFAASFASEIGSCVQQGIELARQGEGIRIAFERLGRGDILDGLREATHGTVTDLELMKAAVKFNDFKLPVEELGTMLAFAQQKAKDTGQSVDYMVDSIVTGLGRKSLMILDNLGLSAAEIKERMKETGDMTKAVGAIIRDQMAAAGDYVETAADRATKADVELKNAMEELGRTFQPLTDAGTSMWTTLETGALKFLSSVGSVIAQLTEAGRIAKQYGNMSGSEKVGNMLNYLKTIKTDKYRQGTYKLQVGKFDERINSYQQYLDDYKAWNDKKSIAAYDRMKAFQQRTGLSMYSDVKEQMGVYQRMRAEYMQGASGILNPTKPVTTTTTGPKKGVKEDKDEFTEVIGLIGNAQEKVSDLQRQISESWDEGEIARLTEDLKAAEKELQRLKDIGKDVDLDKLFPEQSISGASKSWAESMRESLISDLGNSMMAADKSAIQNIIKEGFANGIDLTEAGNELMAQLFEGMDVPDDKIKELLEKVNEKIRENGGIELTVDTNTGDVSKKKKGGPMDDTKKVVNGLSQVASGLQQMGIQLPEGVNQVLGVVNGLMSILQGINTVIGVTQFAAITANTVSLDLLTAAIWANTASSFIPFAGGGTVHAANGWVGGNSFSGDRIPALLNSGELVLNRAQQGVLADALQGGGAGSLGLSVKVTAEELRFVLGNNSRRRGKGEYVTTNRLK